MKTAFAIARLALLTACADASDPDVAAPECTTESGAPGALIGDDCGELCSAASECEEPGPCQTAACLQLPHESVKVCTYWNTCDGG